MPEYKIIYAESRGYAEVARQIFAYAQVQYEDYRFDYRSLTPEKKQELGLPWGQIPVLLVDGVKYGQSLAFTRYLARKYGLVGKNDLEELKCDEIIDAFRDFQSKLMPLYMVLVKPLPNGEIDTAKLEELMKPIREVAPKEMARFNKILEQSQNGYFIPSGFTWADLYMVVGLTGVEQVFPQLELMKEFPALKKLVQKVENLPGIKEWIETRPKTRF